MKIISYIIPGKGYTGAHQNPDGTWVCGGAHTGAHQNPNGTWVCGGALIISKD